MRFAQESRRCAVILGNGSNILAADGWISMVAVKTCFDNPEIELHDDVIRAGSGVTLSKLAMTARKTLFRT
jgi:UDP-N-acetylenolpyruvoylglucosamine reductase